MCTVATGNFILLNKGEDCTGFFVYIPNATFPSTQTQSGVRLHMCSGKDNHTA
jgi:hypothetical protein